jgi:hypothetical protein
VRGAEPEFWELIEGGRVRVNAEGITTWCPDAAARQAYVKVVGNPNRLATVIGALMLAPPATLHGNEPTALWDATKILPRAAELPLVEGVEFHVIKRYQPDTDGYRFLHGVALAWRQGKLHASFGHNKGGENTETEEARFSVSADGGRTWNPVATIDRGDEPGIGVSHGVFLPLNGRLWAFHGAYRGTMKDVHTRTYLLDDETGQWLSKGTVIGGGFWPLGEPVRMSDGNWILAGISAGGRNPAAVASAELAIIPVEKLRVRP